MVLLQHGLDLLQGPAASLTSLVCFANVLLLGNEELVDVFAIGNLSRHGETRAASEGEVGRRWVYNVGKGGKCIVGRRGELGSD